MENSNNANYLTKHFITQSLQNNPNFLTINPDKGLRIFCEDHPNEIITNFCCILDCLKPLCPECIDYHNKFHKQNQQYPEIDTLRNVKINCSKKVKAAILSLTQELERMEMKFMINPQEIIDEGLETLRRCREKILQMVNAFFDNLELNYKKKLNETVFKGHDYTAIFEKIKNLIHELEFLQTSLESGNNTLSVVKKICLLDLKTLLDKYKQEINDLIEARTIIQTDIIVNESRLGVIESELSKFASVNQSKQGKYSGNIPVSTNLGVSAFAEPYFNTNATSPNIKVNLINSLNQNPFLEKPNQKFQSNISQQFNPSFEEDFKRSNLPVDYSTPQREETVKKAGAGAGTGQTGYAQSKMGSFLITMNDYFDSKCQHKVLHFFPYEQKTLYVLDFEKIKRDNETRFECLNIDIDFRIPNFHKSIITPNGDIILTGGSISDNSGRKSNGSFVYDWNNSTLRALPNMINGRSSHGICYLNGFIFVVGGFLNGQTFTTKCEKYNVQGRNWKQIANLNYNSVACSLSGFNQKYLFKFGGLIDGLLINNFIERYDISHDMWTIIEPQLNNSDSLMKNAKDFKLLSTSASIQINKNEIMVFGGYHQDNQASSNCFFLRAENDDDNFYEIKRVDSCQLPFSEGFWNNTPIIMYKNIFALQNIPNDKNDDCLENVRRVLVFNSKEWISLN